MEEIFLKLADIRKEPNSFWYHEDDFGQVELLPVENLAFIREEFGKTDEEEEEEGDSDIVWPDMDLNDIDPVTLISKRIEMSDITDFTERLGLNLYEKVYYGSADSGCFAPMTHGFSGFLFNVDKDGIVTNIWIVDTEREEAEAERLSRLISAFGRTYDLLLVDWTTHHVIQAENLEGLKKYFK